MKHHAAIFGSLALAAGLFAAGCATTGNAASAFPFGKYRSGDTVAIFNADGTFVGTTTTGEDWVKGILTIEGDQLSLEDTWEGEQLVAQMGTSCLGLKGRYRWVLAGDVLTAHVVEDACEGRRKGTDGVPWTRMP